MKLADYGSVTSCMVSEFSEFQWYFVTGDCQNRFKEDTRGIHLKKLTCEELLKAQIRGATREDRRKRQVFEKGA